MIMKRILILANNDIVLYKFRKELIEELTKEYKVYISLPDGGFIPNLLELGCEFINTPISRRGANPFTDLKLILNYIKIIKQVKPNIVLTYTIKPNIYGGIVCRMYKIPYIVNVTGLGSAVGNGGLIQRITLWLYKIALKKAYCVFFQNIENQEFMIKKKLIRGKYKLIPGSGVNIEQYKTDNYPKDNYVNFLYVSRIMKEKGIEEYLEAAKYIKSKYPNTIFHIVGFCEEEYQDKLVELEKKGIIKYHGFQRDVLEFYRKAHCIIHPTYYPEGMSNVLLESAACGRAIITTNRSGCREVVNDNVNGYLIEPRNVNDLIIKIEKFLKLSYPEKKQMGIEGRKKVENEFDRKIIVETYLENIKEVLR